VFYHLFSQYITTFNPLRVFTYVTFRSAGAFITALIFSYLFGPWIINTLKRHLAVETIDEDMPDRHQAKQGTPTMGGLIILIGLLGSSLLWTRLDNSYIWMMYLTTIWLGIFGFIDDYLKNFAKSKKGLIPKYKLMGQVSVSLMIALFLYFSNDIEYLAYIDLPFLKHTAIFLGFMFIPVVIFIVVGTSNAVNLTNGLDGLAEGISAIVALGLGIMSYLKGNINYADYLNLGFIPKAGELTVFIAALVGTLIGFLWYNCRPAEIFMGDTGSLPLGGILAMLSILLREQIFLAIVGFVFIAEAMSVIIQVRYFKFTKKRYGVGRRVFKMAPLHHHYELLGFAESKIVVRFWIITILLLVIGLSTIKLR